MTEILSEVANASTEGARDTVENAESAISIKNQSMEVSELIKKSTESTMNLEREVKKFIV